MVNRRRHGDQYGPLYTKSVSVQADSPGLPTVHVYLHRQRTENIVFFSVVACV